MVYTTRAHAFTQLLLACFIQPGVRKTLRLIHRLVLDSFGSDQKFPLFGRHRYLFVHRLKFLK